MKIRWVFSRSKIKLRYDEKVVRGPHDTCWAWTGAVSRFGHGKLMMPSGLSGRVWSSSQAHRAGWILYVGPIPRGKQVLHGCDTPWCQNPAHWHLGTNSDNMEEKRVRGRAYRPRGELHPLAVLTEADVQELRAAVASGIPQKEVARKLGVARSTVSQIVNGHRWRTETQT